MDIGPSQYSQINLQSRTTFFGDVTHFLIDCDQYKKMKLIFNVFTTFLLVEKLLFLGNLLHKTFEKLPSFLVKMRIDFGKNLTLRKMVGKCHLQAVRVFEEMYNKDVQVMIVWCLRLAPQIVLCIYSKC